MSNSNDDVAHAWANQTRESMKSGNGNFSFQDRRLYSYSTLIGYLHESGVALMNHRTFSVTTSGKHMGPARRAAGYKTIEVDVVEPIGTYDHERNIAYFTDAIADCVRSANAARTRKAYHLASAQGYVNQGNKYIAMFRDVLAETVVPFDLGSDFLERIAEAEQIADAERKAAEAKAVEREKKRREAWINGMAVTAPSHGGIVLRAVGDVLETSWGARVPLADAVKVFRAAIRCRSLGTGWLNMAPGGANVVEFKVGDYRLTRIEPTGDITVGCHKIAWAEAERLAVKLGILEVTSN